MGDIPPPEEVQSSEQGSMDDTAQTDIHHGHRWIWFITGPTACGKTTIAKALAEDLNFTFLEGDDFHTKASIDKMSRGEPLDDADRKGWLETLRDHETVQPLDGSGATPPHLVITCSALKRQYRDVLREGGVRAGNLRIRFVLLDAPLDVLMRRSAARKEHFAGPSLVRSQLEALERPAEDEDDVLVVDTADRTIEDTERAVSIQVREAMMEDDGSYLRLL